MAHSHLDKPRRLLITGSLGFGVLVAAGPHARAQTDGDSLVEETDISNKNKKLQDWQRFAPAGVQLPAVDQKLVLDDAAWRKRLPDEAYRVLRREGTERAFTSGLLDEKRRGLYLCAGCDLPLFTSAMKYDSGTGWPSFTTVIEGHIGTKRDFRLLLPRTEYHCARCGGHQGHVFDDGPPPTGQRWCNNGVALKFLPSDTSADTA